MATITYSHHSLIKGERKGSLDGSIATIILAIVFTVFQGALWSRISLMCLQLSNSGKFLKLLVPNDGPKAMRGWISYSCMVISQNMKETEMDYRGSKSVVTKGTIVKEQRADGGWHGWWLSPWSRCTLMCFERNYQVKIPSNQIINKFRSYTNITIQQCLTQNLTQRMNPWFVTGFAGPPAPREAIQPPGWCGGGSCELLYL